MDHQLPIVETGASRPAPNPADGADAASSLHLHWADEAATQAFAERLAAQPALADALLTLQGDLGAGKTTLTRYLLQALGVQGRIKSPTYTLVETYEAAGRALSHFDFYRFNDPLEWEDAGFRDIFASPGLKVVEWPQKAQDLLPSADLEIHLQAQGTAQRAARLQALSPRGQQLLAGLRQALAPGL